MALITHSIIYEDAHLLVVDKKPGIPVIPDRQGNASLKQKLERIYDTIFTVHRIDRDTSGLVLFAKHPEAHRLLSMQFESHTVKKKYLAIVQGSLSDSLLEIDAPIGKHPRKANVMIIDPKGKTAHSICVRKEIFKHASLAEIEILTGRTHQVRVHMHYAGYTLLVDPVYSNKPAFFLSEIKHNYKMKAEESPLIQRLTLHAAYLEFLHPALETVVTFTSELPGDMELVLKMLRKYDNINPV